MFHLNKINISVNDSKENLTTLGKKRLHCCKLRAFTSETKINVHQNESRRHNFVKEMCS